jgi:ABC-type sugar transport system ATPase subunit
MFETLVAFENISKTYPGVKALRDVTFNVKKGSTHALVGENGAGKSTFIKICVGIEKMDSGVIKWCGEPVKINNPSDAVNIGIAAVHQEFPLCLNMTVAQNIFLPQLSKTSIKFIDWSVYNKKSQELLNEFEVDFSPKTEASMLSISQRQIVEICKAINLKVKLIIMDEPTSALGLKDLEKFFSIIRKLKEKNVTLIYVSHKLDEVFEVADEITVLRDGEKVETLTTKETTPSEISSYMVGKKLEYIFDEDQSINNVFLGNILGENVLEIKNLCVKDQLRNVDISLKKGEILGIAGLQGSGVDALFEALFGLQRIESGEVIIEGKLAKIDTPQDAIKYRLAYIPADRHEEGLNLLGNVFENIGLTVLSKFAKNGIINKRNLAKYVNGWVENLSIKARNIWQDVSSLSGGNQQKVVIAKWLSIDPLILIMNDPTRGVDVGAKAEIHKILKNFIKEGRSCIWTSTELQELVSLSNRIVTIFKGEINGEFNKENVTKEKIMENITGAKHERR